LKGFKSRNSSQSLTTHRRVLSFFIQGEDGQDVFVHRTDVPLGVFLNEGDAVEYQVENTNRGLKATHIKKL